jgi:hypothetical protein
LEFALLTNKEVGGFSFSGSAALEGSVLITEFRNECL